MHGMQRVLRNDMEPDEAGSIYPAALLELRLSVFGRDASRQRVPSGKSSIG